jgi:acyl-coenzyme A thioesterase PaaI-like protein
MIDSDNMVGKHMLSELGFRVWRAGAELHGSADVTRYMHVPGTERLRTSVLAMWADMLGGLLALDVVAPRVPVTLELDVHLNRPAPVAGRVLAVGRQVKAGRSVFVATVDFFDADGDLFGFSAGSFMVAPGSSLTMSERTSVDAPPYPFQLSVPLAERAGCARRAPGVAEIQLSPDGLNAAHTMHGGLVAMVAEEAALSLSPGQTLCSLTVRYLNPVRVGPAVAVATGRGGLSQVELHDAGHGGKLAALVTARTFAA